MIELESPQIEPVEEAGTYAKYEAGPLQAGYGVTLGNALKRGASRFVSTGVSDHRADGFMLRIRPSVG